MKHDKKHPVGTETVASETIGLFPTPIQITRGILPKKLIAALISQFEQDETIPNVRTGLLTHTEMASPRSHENYMGVMSFVMPQIRKYGETLLGEDLNWAVKEIWINRMVEGGAQKMHNHANSFISGVIYLTEVERAASTIFHRHVGSNTFVMSNENKRCKLGPYNAPVYQMPAVAPGDMVLFPSYVMHEVPPNPGKPRMTAAFNALPERLDSWGYTLSFR
jgi:uncharacterized protein (TIGR02466 family)